MSNFQVMKCLSKVFQPLITIPKNAKIKNTEITCKSQKLLLECGLVRPTSSGLFALLPLALRSLHKLETLARDCMEQAGAQEMSLPSLSSARLWECSGRLQEAVELMMLDDRHGKKYILAPTHEEGVADLLADVGPLSYKQLPIILYQISNKYRDEHRPKHGLLRAREFRMLDAYAAHTDMQCAEDTYIRLTDAYSRLFQTLRLPVHRVSAPAGDMGGAGAESHEWQLCARAGEDALALCTRCAAPYHPTPNGVCEHCHATLQTHNSIEVGHTFILGTKYSDPLEAKYIPPSGAAQSVIMSCYGIGLTRLLAAGLEALSSETALRWPEHIAPFNTIIIGPKEGSKEWTASGPSAIRAVYDAVTGPGRDAIYDDRHHLTIGKKLMMADRMGYPNIVVLGRTVLDDTPKYEVHGRDSNPRLMTLKELRDFTPLEHREINIV